MSEADRELDVNVNVSRANSPRFDQKNVERSNSAQPNSSVRLNDLRKQRGNIKCKLTLFEKYVKGLDKNNIGLVERFQLTLRINNAEDILKRFNEVQSEIEFLSDDCDLPAHFEYEEQFESCYYSAVALAKCLLNENKPETSQSEQPQTHSHCHISKPVSIKLPEMKLPAFDGSYDQWLEFRNSYITMIHERKDLDSIQKFHYLKSSLSGSALQVISALEFTAFNYTHAWELLENRYHNNRLLVHNHVKSLFTTQSLSKESPAQIRKLIDATLRNLRALKSLKEPTDSWDTLIVYLIVSKLDASTEREWESHKGTLLSDSSRDNLKLDDLLTFLRNRADMLDMIKYNHVNLSSKSNCESKQPQNHKKQSNAQNTYSYLSNTTTNKSNSNQNTKRYPPCPFCNGKHALYSCANFLNLPVQDRAKLVTEKNLCPNCIRTNSHSANDCAFGPCKLCQKKHNTLLHVDATRSQSSHTQPPPVNNNTSSPQSSVLHCVSKTADSNIFDPKCDSLAANATMLQPVLLSTALVEVADYDNKYHTVRALLDNGSQNCFMTEKLCKRLNVPILQSTIRISGIGQVVSQSNHACDIKMRSKVCDFHTDIHCLVLPSIAPKLPSINVNSDAIGIPSHVQLADSTFHIPSEIELLIGADIFWDLLNNNKIKLASGPYLQDSKVGWILSGPIYNIRKHALSTDEVQCNFSQCDSQLRKFWEIEEISNPPVSLSREERICEDIFSKTTERDEHGRFSVTMPLKETADSLGDSFTIAKNRFLSLERKLDRLPDYKLLYSDFIREYENLGHMSLLSDNINDLPKPYYILPHHGVYRESSSTTKLRVVFDASATTTSKKSLNDIQYVGPTLQNDIFSILLRFRQYKYVACADIEKMYRQILINSDQRNLQLILWRTNRDKPLQIYRLNTVTYGTASAPYLSIRCLKQLAQDCNDDVIARIISDDFYVDDLITGHDEFETLIDICSKTSGVLQSACFPLRKWTFNDVGVASESTKDFSMGEHCQSKTLGLGWSNKSDELHFTTKLKISDSKVTKRLMMSVISQIYDPLGLLAPTIITAKVLLQKLWLSKIDWDDEVPADISSEWRQFISTLECLPDIRVPRYVTYNDKQHKDLHIFSDASQTAYGACAYIRSYNNDENAPAIVRLLCAKSKVAPIKAISIPRLELCGALVGAKLYKKIIDSLRLKFDKVYFWTDSTIVQGWLRMSPHLLKTFVQNRVGQINELTSDTVWRHVKGKENPADLLSRGVHLDSLQNENKSLWWYGPSFLRENSSTWSNNSEELNVAQLPELKSETSCFTSTNPPDLIDFDRFSNFNRLQRAGAYVLRFVYNTRASKRKQDRKTGPLSVEELNSSVQMLTRLAQHQSFTDEYDNIIRKLPVKIKSNKSFNKIAGLNIFIDNNNIIRVGGRLCNSEFSYNKKHPVLLSSKHRFTRLLCTYEHRRLLHGGPQLLVFTMRDEWWILGARNLARQVVRECVTCTRMKGKVLTPVMGNLPSARLEPGFPFMRCGVDYAGPVFVLNRKGRGSKLIKSYICLFICFATRAVHLELVTSLSTQDYILALKRFISRRGKPCQIFSDNGKNFVGAERELSAIFHNTVDIIDFATNNNIQFKFIPPYAPHFGGLWEAGVKSCKHHLRRIVGCAHLTYEEFNTVLTQIEAVLNSRPMSPLSSDPSDFLPLTPAHFLVGRPLTAPATDELTTTASTRLGRYERLEQLRQNFWKRWSKEYVSELQRKTKWIDNKEDIARDRLVLIKEENVSPLNWRMGRIIRMFPGQDGVSRVAEIRTASGIIQRACSKICPLPVREISCDDEELDLEELGSSKGPGMLAH